MTLPPPSSPLAENFLPLVYADLHELAARFMQRQPRDHTLQATALVHEAWLKLCAGARTGWEDRRHFLAVAVKTMRAVLVDHARARQAQKRGGGQASRPLDGAAVATAGPERVVMLHESIERLAGIDAQLAQIVELRAFGGMCVEETARVLDVSPRTVIRGWRVATAWLRQDLGDVP
jgi:RNA polymerase sigma factor (TIGR02999 family)